MSEVDENLINKRASLLTNVPDFSERIYDDPKALHQEYLAFERDVITAITNAKTALYRVSITISEYDTYDLQFCSMNGELAEKNNAIRELNRSIKYLFELLQSIRNILSTEFEESFQPKADRQYGVEYKTLSYFNVYIFQNKADMLKYLCVKAAEFDNIKTKVMDDTTFPILTNNLRYEGFKVHEYLYRTVFKFESDRSCVELENGHWAIIKI